MKKNTAPIAVPPPASGGGFPAALPDCQGQGAGESAPETTETEVEDE